VNTPTRTSTPATSPTRTPTRTSTPTSGDQTPPTCQENVINDQYGRYSHQEFVIRDTGSGMARIELIQLVNAGNVQIPVFTPGTTSQLIVTAVVIDRTKPDIELLRLTDVAGNVYDCDPVGITLTSQPGLPVFQPVEVAAPVERYVDVYNFNPGVQGVVLLVNGQIFTVSGLADGESRRSIDIGAAIADEDGMVRVWLYAWGDPGAQVMVRIHN
jgi:hypothetical protein